MTLIRAKLDGSGTDVVPPRIASTPKLSFVVAEVRLKVKVKSLSEPRMDGTIKSEK